MLMIESVVIYTEIKLSISFFKSWGAFTFTVLVSSFVPLEQEEKRINKISVKKQSLILSKDKALFNMKNNLFTNVKFTRG